jgi:tRNA(Ile)-lysidine synthase
MGVHDSTIWRSHVERILRRYDGRTVVVAVSSGSDSVGLVRLLHEFSLDLSIAHLNHGTRGDVAKADAEFVANLAETLGLPFDLGQWQPTRAGHFESDARKARYDWLIDVAKRRNATLIAVGHTRDDQAETILHRILRGTGPRGLAGIPRRRKLADGVTLIRPLRDVSRAEIRRYLDEIGQTFRDDASNAVLDRTRNRIRHDLLPKLEQEYNPAIRDALIRLGRISGDFHVWNTQLDLQLKAATVSISDAAVELLNEPLRALPLSVRAEVIRRAWKSAGWPEREMDAERWLRLAAAVEGGPARFSIGGGIDVWMSQDVLRMALSTSDQDRSSSPLFLAIPGGVTWGSIQISASFEADSSVGITSSGLARVPLVVPDQCSSASVQRHRSSTTSGIRADGRSRGEAIDFDRLQPLLTSEGSPYLLVRTLQDGDRFDPLGMGGHTQPLNDFFRGRNVSHNDRKVVPIVCDKEGIVWVVDFRIAERVKRTESTRRVLYLGRD